MTIGKVEIERHEERVGWFRMTFTSLPDFIGQTKVEMIIREQDLRKIRNEADLALSNKPKRNPLDALREDK